MTTVKISWSENVSPAFVLSLLSAPVSSIVDAKEALAHQQGDDLGHQWLNSHRRQRPLQNPHLCAARSGGAGRQPVLAGRGADAENHPDQKRARSGRAPLADRAGRCRYRAQPGADQMAALKGKPGVKPRPFLTLRFISCSSTPRRHRRSAIRRSGKRRAGCSITKASPTIC